MSICEARINGFLFVSEQKQGLLFVVLQEVNGMPFSAYSTDSESSVTAGTTETQPSGDYYGDSKLYIYIDRWIDIIMLYVNT